MRAFAILSVLGFHAFPTIISGGFAGVDVFFVISGYVISLSVFQDIDNNCFAALKFYARRVRRLFPSLLVVLLTCLGAGLLLLQPVELEELANHVSAGAIFVSNFALWRESGYFDAPSAYKPLLHLWSLAVEEQFYLIWPVVYLMSRKSATRAFAVALAVTLVSLAYDCVLTSSGDIAGFYAPQCRLWEPMIGVILAYAERYGIPGAFKPQGAFFDLLRRRIEPVLPSRSCLRNIGSVTGAAACLGAVLLLGPGDPYPGQLALVPTIGTAMMIGTGDKSFVNRCLLSHRLPVFIGLVSYPLYLWHWPLIAFFQHFVEGPSVPVRLALFVVLPFCLAILTYKFVERPIRKARNPGRVAILLLVLMLGMALLGRTTAIRSDLDAQNAQVPDLYKDWGTWRFISNRTCAMRYGGSLSRVCIASSATPTIALLGDSHANQLYPGLAKATTTAEGVVSVGNAPALEGVNVNYEKIKNEDWLDSPKSFDKVMEVLEHDDSIKTLIIGGNWEPLVHGQFQPGVARAINGPVLVIPQGNKRSESPESVFAQAFSATVARAVASGKNVVVAIDSPEPFVDPRSCLAQQQATLLALHADCRFSADRVLADQAEFRALLAKLTEQYPHLKIFDPIPILCPNGVCDLFSPVLMYRDHNHLTRAASERLGPPLYRLVESFDVTNATPLVSTPTGVD